MAQREEVAASLIAIATSILEREQLDCVVIEEGVAIRTAMSAPIEDELLGWTCHIEVAALSPSVSALVAFSRPYEPLERAHRVAALELINRINASLMAVGNLEIDEEDELTLRTGLVCAQAEELTPEAIEHVLFINWAEIERYLPAVLRVSRGELVDKVWLELT